MKPSVLVVDDELLIRKSLSKVLRAKGMQVEAASTGAEGLEKASRLRPQVMILDMRLPDTDGLSLLRRLRQIDPILQVVVITAYGDLSSAVEAMKLGACDFLRKPYEMEDIELAVEAAVRTFRQQKDLDLYRRNAWQRFSHEEIVGSCEAMKQVRQLIEKVVRSQATTVLIVGQSGTGKELVARAIHYKSDRSQAPLMEVNCSSFHENLLENELFGHEKGAFTDAGSLKKGLVELCDGGTLFLDEVADMPLATQAKLLRFIDHRSFKRVGGATDVTVDIRIVTATNKDLDEEVRGARFRSDLYFRLKVVAIELPPLRDRGADILTLARHFLREYSHKFQKRFREVAPDAARLMLGYAWPGNVRELKNLVERAVLLEDDEMLRVEHLTPEILGLRPEPVDAAGSPVAAGGDGGGRADRQAPMTLAQLEAEHIAEVLRLTRGNKSSAARILGISRQGLIEKLRRMKPALERQRQLS